MLDLKTSECFHSLSELVKESIMQSGIRFENEEELLRVVEQYTQPQE